MTWERFVEAMVSSGHDELAKMIREKFCSPPETEEVAKPSPADQSLKEKVRISLYFCITDTYTTSVSCRPRDTLVYQNTRLWCSLRWETVAPR